MNDPLLKCKNICKSFSGVKALEDIDFNIHAGTVHGLIGENGAGKSTLIKIISGVYSLDSGAVSHLGKKINIGSTEEMLRRGIATIYQDINLIENMTIAENIFLNNEPKYKYINILKEKQLRKKTAALLNSYDINEDPNAIIRDLPNDVKKMIQILKAISRNAKILLMDEPSSSLTKVEEKKVLKLIKTLSGEGMAIVFISHYLSEVFEVCDDITVLRDGKLVDTIETDQTDLSAVVSMMIGRTIDEEEIKRSSYKKKEEVLRVDNLSVKGKLEDISFDLSKGEVLGFTGLVGSGCSELAKAVFGSIDIKKEKGEFKINGKKVSINHPEQAIKNRIAYITDDRVGEGLFRTLPIYENITLPILNRFRRNK